MDTNTREICHCYSTCAIKGLYYLDIWRCHLRNGRCVALLNNREKEINIAGNAVEN